jgi:uncharacterized protein YjiS (DUF1127 family)
MSVMPILDLPRHSERFVNVRAVLAALTATIAASIARELRIRRDMRRLGELDDAMLRDIGIARSEIECAVRRGRSSAP